MSILTSAIRSLGNSLYHCAPSLLKQTSISHHPFSKLSFLGSLKRQPVCVCPDVQRFLRAPNVSFHSSSPMQITLEYMHRKGVYKKVKKKKKSPLEGRPQMRGVVLKTVIKKPKKPNSANRKCVRLRLTNGKEITAYVPGEGHNLQEHNIVLVEGGKLQDTPGVKLVCIRGKYDLSHVKKKE